MLGLFQTNERPKPFVDPMLKCVISSCGGARLQNPWYRNAPNSIRDLEFAKVPGCALRLPCLRRVRRTVACWSNISHYQCFPTSRQLFASSNSSKLCNKHSSSASSLWDSLTRVHNVCPPSEMGRQCYPEGTAY